MPDNKEKNKKSTLSDLFGKPLISGNKSLQYSGLGVQLAATIIVFLFIGIWIDKWLETRFIFTLVFTFIGFFGGFYSFYLNIKKLTEEEKNKH